MLDNRNIFREPLYEWVLGKYDCWTGFRKKPARIALEGTQSMPQIGYARVSTHEQELDLQLDALRAAGCERIFEDRGVSGVKVARPGLDDLVRFVRDGDVLTVYKLDRLGRSMAHLLALVAELEARGVGFRSLTENVDTTTPGGRLVFHLFGALAQFERDLIAERTKAGLAAALVRGRKGGRPRSVSTPKLAEALRLKNGGQLTIVEIAKRLRIGKSSLYAELAAHKAAVASSGISQD